MHTIHIQRVYEPVVDGQGLFLVDRLWPRGIRRAELGQFIWLKDAGPSHELRRWFGHDPSKWLEFQRRYFGELDSSPGVSSRLLEALRANDVTLLYGARDPVHNNAAALKAYLITKAAASPATTTAAEPTGR